MRWHPPLPVIKNPPPNPGDIRDPGSVPGLGGSPGGGHGAHSSILAWRILWIEKPGELPSLGLQRVRHDLSDLAYTRKGDKQRVSSLSERERFWGFSWESWHGLGWRFPSEPVAARLPGQSTLNCCVD